MSDIATLSRRPLRNFWGWGEVGQDLAADEAERVRANVAALAGGGVVEVPAPRVEQFALAPPRVQPPSALQGLLSCTPYDRLVHALGKSFADGARMLMRQVPHAPDWVAFPSNEQEVVDLLDWAARANVAVLPFGGGSSVCGGVEPAVGDGYAAALAIDMERFDRVLEVDPVSRSARIQAGALGPQLEDQLRPHALTLRHFPQSFQFSSLGGWIATRAGGHYATLATHIDDRVQAIRCITPAGVVQTRKLPASGAGPAPERLLIGSEGTLGIITEAWLRLQQRPRFRGSVPVSFSDFAEGRRALRALAQSGLHPSNCRLLDGDEAALSGMGHGIAALMILGFESADHPVRPAMERALELVRDHNGRFDEAAAERSMLEPADDESGEHRAGAAGAPSHRAGAAGQPSHRTGAAGAWREAFIRMPYMRNLTTRLGAVIDTFESAVTWDKLDAFYTGVRRDVMAATRRATGGHALLACRITHAYPDGAAPYFTVAVQGSRSGDIASALAIWRDIKHACNAAVVAHGGTITHHHAVGRDHRSGYEVEVPALYRQALAGAKAVLDPAGIMNPGVLIDPVGRRVGITGALG